MPPDLSPWIPLPMPHAPAEQLHGIQWDNMGFPGTQSGKADSLRKLKTLATPPIVRVQSVARKL